MRRKKAFKITIIAVTALFAVYIIFIYFLVSACLVPSFMDKLDAFEEITQKSYAEQVHTTAIDENRHELLAQTDDWLKSVSKQKLTVETSDGYKLVATEFLADKSCDVWVIVLHGYTGWKEEMYEFACWYSKQGYNVIVPDLRCQGESEGDFIGMGYTDHFDCGLWIDYILKQNADAGIIIHGQSMGAATALIMSGDEATCENVVAIVSDSAYTDAYSMFGDKITEWFNLPPFPFVDSACLMLRLRGGYDLRRACAIEAVKKSHVPTLFIHGSLDAMISVDMAYKLYDAAACEKELYIVEDAGHAQTQDKDPDKYFEVISKFIEKYMCDVK